MAVVRRPPYHRNNPSTMRTVLIVLFVIVTVMFFTSSSKDSIGNANSLRMHSEQATIPGPNADYKIPSRIRDLLEKNEVVGDRLADIKAGKLTVEEALHGEKQHTDEINKPPMSIKEITDFVSDFLHQFHQIQLSHKKARFYEIWQAYHDFAVKTLFPWDREYLQRMPVRRFDDTIFLSLASYRDENCFNTIKGAYEKSKNPEKLYVGLVQQNCVKNCRSGVLKDLSMVVRYMSLLSNFEFLP